MGSKSNKTGVLIRAGRDTRDAFAQSRGQEGTQPEGGHLQAKETGLERNQPCQHLDLGLPDSTTVRNKFLLA